MGRYSVLVAIIGLVLVLVASCAASPSKNPSSTSVQTPSSSVTNAQIPTSLATTNSTKPRPSFPPIPPWSTIENSSSTSPTLPSPLPTLIASNQDLIDKSIVQVWGIGNDHSTGLVVGDGNQILTTWNFEDWNPTPYFNIMIPGGGSYRADIQAFDSRTAMTLLKADVMNLPTAPIGDPQKLIAGQEVIVREWDSQGELSKVPMVVSTMATISERSFSVGYPAVAIQEASFKEISPGAIVSDQQDSVLGVLGVFYNDVILASHPHSTSIIPQIPPVSNISSIGDLLSTDAAYQTWANLPLQAVISTNVATGIYTRFSDDNGATSQALSDLETELGNALPANELKGYQRVGYPDYDGSIITVIYAFPVILRLLDGTQLAKARWVGIQWNRKNNAPNRLFYGNEASTVLGGHYLVGDVSTLDRGVSTLLPYQGSNGTVTVTASTPH